MKHYIYIALLALLVTAACNNSETSGWEEVDLMSYGVATKLYAPIGVEVTENKGLLGKDLVLKDSAGYNLQLFMADSYEDDLAARLAEEKKVVEEMEYFHEIVEEFPQGFVFSLQLDSASIAHDFRYLEIAGDKEYVMQMGFGQMADLEQVNNVLDGIRRSRED